MGTQVSARPVTQQNEGVPLIIAFGAWLITIDEVAAFSFGLFLKR